LVLFIYITRLASNEIFSPSNKIQGEVGQAKDLASSRVQIVPASLDHTLALSYSLSVPHYFRLYYYSKIQGRTGIYFHVKCVFLPSPSAV